MVHLHRRQESPETNHLLPLVHSPDSYWGRYRKAKPTLIRLFLFFSIFSFTFFFFPRLLFPSNYSSLLSLDEQETGSSTGFPCSSLVHPNNNSHTSAICCDRTSPRSDICYMRGDVRTDSQSNSLLSLSSFTNTTSTTATAVDEEEEEKIRPYTRKWETNTMSTIDELHLLRRRRATNNTNMGGCDVRHDVPAVVFSTGGYTGNVYHEFNDGIIPLYITSQRFNRKVVFVILEYHDWWITKYDNILAKLSDFSPIDFSNNKRTHCFPQAIVGLKIHDELSIDPSQMSNNKTIQNFRQLLDEAYRPRIEYITNEEEENRERKQIKKPRLVIISRNGSRGIENEEELVRLADSMGFHVQVLRPDKTTELAKIYRALNSSDVMIGVHGAAMTHFLFMRPGSVFIQIVPLGTDWAAENYYGQPAVKLGLRYMSYKIEPKESSLYREYHRDDPVLRDPESVNARGWEVTKRVYLDGQNVRLDLTRFRTSLVKARQHVAASKGGRKILEAER